MSIPIKKNRLSLAVKLALGLVTTAATLTGAGAVLAQDEQLIEEVVITGSRIKRNDSNSISPMTTLSSEDLAVSGNLTLENFLQDLPAMNGGDLGSHGR